MYKVYTNSLFIHFETLKHGCQKRSLLNKCVCHSVCVYFSYGSSEHLTCFTCPLLSGYHHSDRGPRGAHQNAQSSHLCSRQDGHAVWSQQHQEVEDGLWYQRALGEPADGLGVNVRTTRMILQLTTEPQIVLLLISVFKLRLMGWH